VKKKKFQTSLLLSIALVVLNLIAFQILISGWSTARLDLTRDHLYSITPATERLLVSLEEDVTIYGYFSKKTHPKLSPLVPEIIDMLDEYRAVSGGQVHVEIIDPGEDETAEQIANDRYGVRSTPFRLASKYESGIVNAYFALVVKYGDQYVRYGFGDIIKVEPLPDGDVDVQLQNLEYDLTRAIKKAAFGFRRDAELFERVEGPVTLTVIISPESLPEIFSDVPDAVATAVGELKEKGGDKFTFEEIDPSQSDQLAQQVYSQYGAQPMSLGLFGGGRFYLYGILRVGDRLEQITLAKETLSAADIREAVENSLRRHTPGFLKTVGISKPGPDLPPEVRQQLMMQGQQMPPPEFQQIGSFLEQDYNVQPVNLALPSGVPSEIDVLLVIEPRNLDERAVYNLDQFLMRGGRAVLCVGNYKVDFDQQGLRASLQPTGVDDWLGHFGVEVAKTLVLDDRNRPLPLPQVRQTALGLIRTWNLVPYPYLVNVREEGLINSEVAGDLESVGIYWGSPVNVGVDTLGRTEVYELLRSSEKSWTSSDAASVGFVNYTVPDEGAEPHLLAAALSGRFESYFADRAPPARTTTGTEDEETEPLLETPLKLSPETRLIVIGNSAFLSDLVAGILSQPDGGFFAENLRFVENLIDWSVLDSDLITIRSRGVTTPRIERLDRAKEVSVEMVNYIIPAALLLAVGAIRIVRRRQTRSILGSGPGRATASPWSVEKT
jgi:ABC-2 type transport system permease protein